MAQHLTLLAVFLPMILGVLGANNISITTESLVQKEGYPIETHKVKTHDGYILSIHRIPYSPRKSKPASEKRKVAFIQHCLLGSSSDWMLLGKDKGLPFLLSDAGFDVFLGNARGTTYSQGHETLDSSSREFWEFSWNEIGMIDLPTMLDYVRELTGVEKLTYIGHSQGTTSFLVLNSRNPDYNKYFETAHLLAPVVYMSRLKSKFFKYSAPFLGHPTIGVPVDIFGTFEFKPSQKFMDLVASVLCKKDQPNYILCSNALFLLGGFDEKTIDASLIPLAMATTPNRASANQLWHYVQEYNSGKFRQFDYGIIRNMIKYRQTSPPEYLLGNIDVPIYLYYSDNDALAAVEDVEQLIKELRCFVKPYRVPDKQFDHLGQLFNPDVKTLVYDILLENIRTNNATGRRY